tara:strand:+ start:208 stop:366 length:159 start_codon:yes stop_codon:yes gene_type:complete
MADVLSEVNWGDWVGQPVEKLFKKKKAEMLEEQIRDSVPCDVETKEEKDEKL